MAQLILAAAGAAIGGAIAPGAIGILGLTGASAGWLAGSLIGSLLFAPNNKQVGPKLDDLKVSGSSYGTVIPYVEGHPRVSGQIIWASDKRAIEHTEEYGKGGSQSITTYTYEVDLLYAVASVECDVLLRVFSGGDLVANFRTGESAETTVNSGSTDAWARLTFYSGASDQLPDPDYEAAVGLGNAPAYRTWTTIFIKSCNLGNVGQIPNFTFEIAREGTPSVARTIMWEEVSKTLATNPSYDASAPSTDWGDTTERKFGTSSLNSGVWAGDYPYPDLAGTYRPDALMRMNNYWPHVGTWYTIDAWVYLTEYPDYTVGGDVNYQDLFGVNGLMEVVVDSDGCVRPWMYRLAQFWRTVSFPDNADPNYPTPNATSFRGDFITPNGFPGYPGVIPAVSKNPKPVELNRWVHVACWYYEGEIFTRVDDEVHRHGWMPYVISGGSTLLPPITSNMLQPAPDWPYPVYHSKGTPFRQTFKPGWMGWYWYGSDMLHLEAIKHMESGFLDGQSRYPLRAQMVSATTTPPATPGVGPQQTDALRMSHSAIFFDTEPGYKDFYAPPTKDAYTKALYNFDLQGTASSVDPLVSDVVSRLLVDCAKLPDTNFDVTDIVPIPTRVHAMAVGQVSTPRAVIETLMACYFFDSVASDKIYFRRRGSAPVATIPFDDLGWTNEGQSVSEVLPKVLGDDLTLPQQIALSYSNIDGDQQTDTQHSDRIVQGGQESLSIVQIPLGFTPSEAKIIADARLLDLAVSLLTTKFSLGLEYSDLEPTDVVTVIDKDESPFRFRLLRRVDEGSVLNFEACADDATILVQLGITAGGPPSQTVVLAVPRTVLELMDIPLLRDTDNTPGFYLAVKGENQRWRGASLYQSMDGVTYQFYQPVAGAAVIGLTESTLQNYTGLSVFDERSFVYVNVGNGRLSSVSRNDILNSVTVNAALVGNEIIRFRTATLQGDGVYRLTGLLRGQTGTEWAMGSHVIAERFVLFGTSGMRFVPVPVPELFRNRWVKAPAVGQQLLDAVPEVITPQAENMRPLSPVHVYSQRENNGDRTLSWLARTRLSTRFGGPQPSVAPLGENTEAYQVDIFDVDDVLLRTVAVSSPAYTYTAAQQSTDGNAANYFLVYQMSDIAGRGHPGAGAI